VPISHEKDPLRLHAAAPEPRPPVAANHAAQVVALRDRISSGSYADSLETKIALLSNMVFYLYCDLQQGATP
jgi:hypothetical protein